MKRLSSHAVGIDQGSLLLFSDFEEGGAMWTGSGPRVVRRSVAFAGPFLVPPTVSVTLELWDYDQSSNQRGHLLAEAVSERGFDAVFKTWGDTRIARIRVAWTAIGAVAHEDDWDLE